MNIEECKPSSSIRFDFIALIILIGATVCCYGEVKYQDFIRLDDSVNFVDNDKYLGFSSQNVWWMLTSFHWGHWHPMTWLSVAVDQQISQSFGYQVPNPVAIKAGNVLLHLVSSWLVFLISRKTYLLIGVLGGIAETVDRIKWGSWIGLLAALLFIVHPQRVESVAWATERRDCLSTTFLLATFLVMLYNYQRPSIRLSIIGLLLYSCSLLSKAWGITFPAVLIVFIFYFRFVGAKGNQTFQKSTASTAGFTSVIPYVFLAIPTAILAISAQSESGALSQISFESRIQTAIFSFGWYIWKLFWPLQLYPAYVTPIDFGWSSPGVWGGLLLLTLLAAIATNLLKTRPGFTVAIISYLVILSPVSGVAQSGSQLVADRYGYVALIPVWILIAWVAVEFARQSQAVVRNSMIVIFVLLLSTLTFLTRSQVEHWVNPQQLWQHTKSVDPDNYLALLNLGAFSIEENRDEQAIGYFSDAFTSAINHKHPSAISAAGNNLASLLLRTDNKAESSKIYQQILKWIPNDPGAIKGTIELGQKLNNHSLQQLRKLASNEPADISIQGMLGQTLLETGDYNEAAQALRTVIELSGENVDPRHLFNFGLCCQYLGRTRDAEKIFVDVTKKDDRFVSAFNQLGVLYLNSNRLTQAAKAFMKVHELDPNHVNSHFNLGSVYLQQGRQSLAKSEFEKVLKLADTNSKVYRAAESKIEKLAN